MSAETDFYDHLDACKQCRENPFALCRIGKLLLMLAAASSIMLHPVTGCFGGTPGPTVKK